MITTHGAFKLAQTALDNSLSCFNLIAISLKVLFEAFFLQALCDIQDFLCRIHGITLLINRGIAVSANSNARRECTRLL